MGSLLIKNGRLVTVEQVQQKDLLVVGEKIKEIKDSFTAEEIPAGCTVIEAEGKYVFPGIIDAHTHYFLQSRNSTTADDFYTGSVSAAFGGVTSFIDYAGQFTGLTLAEANQRRREQAEGETVLDFSLHQCVYSLHPGIKDELAELKESGINNLKIFTTYRKEGYMLAEESWEELFRLARELKLLITVHAEDNQLIEEIWAGHQSRTEFPPDFHPILRPPQTEYRAIIKLGRLAGQLKMPIYIVHLSSREGYQAVKEIRASGGRLIVETVPHYLLLNKDLLQERQAQKYIMTPPLREEADRQALWQGLQEKGIDLIATDHCSFTVEQKLRSNHCREILPGIPGSETLLPLIFSKGVRSGYFDVRRMIDLLSTRPAKVFGLYPEKGSLQVGTDADLVVFDPKKEVRLADARQHSAAGYTPYAGIELQGYPLITIVRGKVIIKDGNFYGKRGSGQFLPAQESSFDQG